MIRCHACRAPAGWSVSISRITKSKKNAQPGRFLLCFEHAQSVLARDPEAKILFIDPGEQP